MDKIKFDITKGLYLYIFKYIIEEKKEFFKGGDIKKFILENYKKKYSDKGIYLSLQNLVKLNILAYNGKIYELINFKFWSEKFEKKYLDLNLRLEKLKEEEKDLKYIILKINQLK